MTASDLNEVVARKLNGGSLKITAFVDDPIEGAPTNQVACYGPIPAYSTDIKAAWDILGHTRKFFELARHDRHWKARFSDEADEYMSEADTAPRAICEAFLKLDAQ